MMTKRVRSSVDRVRPSCPRDQGCIWNLRNHKYFSSSLLHVSPP